MLGGLAMLPYGLCLTMRVTNNQVPPPDDKGQVGGWLAAVWLDGCLLAGQQCIMCKGHDPKRPPQGPGCLLASDSASWLPPACPAPPLQVRTALDYHIRVIIPCYKEPLDVIQKTVMAALVAPIPANCCRTGGWVARAARVARAGLACVALALG